MRLTRPRLRPAHARPQAAGPSRPARRPRATGDDGAPSSDAPPPPPGRVAGAVEGLRSFKLPDLDDEQVGGRERGGGEGAGRGSLSACDAARTRLLPHTSSLSPQREMISDLADPSALGKRGEALVLAQLATFFFVLFPPLAVTLAVQLAGCAAMAGGAALAVAGVTGIGAKSLTPFPAPRATNALATRGPYALVRHPMYGGLTLVAFGLAAASASPGRMVRGEGNGGWSARAGGPRPASASGAYHPPPPPPSLPLPQAAAAALLYVLTRKVALEEAALARLHGPAWDAYVDATPRMLLPYLW